jgi:selenium metabolism protein YedF
MGDKTLDARGKPCPLPVVEARKVMLVPGTTRLRVLLDNPDSAENVARMAATLGWKAFVEHNGSSSCEVLVEKPDESSQRAAEPDGPAILSRVGGFAPPFGPPPPTPSPLASLGLANPPAMVRGEQSSPAPQATGLVILLTSSCIGEGNPELGRILMRSFIKTIQEVSPLPNTLLFLNSGIHLTTEGSDLLVDLQRIEAAGVELLTCGTCLDYFHKKDQVRAGKVTNMFEIASRLTSAAKVVHL